MGIAKFLFTYLETDLIAFNIVLDPARRLQREFRLLQIAKCAATNLRTYRLDPTKQSIAVESVTINLKELKVLLLVPASIAKNLF